VALMEKGVIDNRNGGYVNNDLENYHVPVCAVGKVIETVKMPV